MKKSIGKAHTLFDDSHPKGPTGIWVLIAECCQEISRSLLKENAYAEQIHAGCSTFDAPLGQVHILGRNFPQYQKQLYACLSHHVELRDLIEQHWREIRRIMVRVDCEAYIQPLFHENSVMENQVELLSRIRTKVQQPHLIGHGLEGCRSLRPLTYTPSRGQEYMRAQKLLAQKAHLLALLKMPADGND